MAELYRYISPEWAAEAYKRLRQELTAEKMKYMTVSMVTQYKNCPDGKERALYYKFVKGVVQALSIVEGELPPADFVISGDYEVFSRVARGELSSRAATTSGKLRMRGSMVKAVSFAAVAERMNKVLTSIPTKY